MIVFVNVTTEEKIHSNNVQIIFFVKKNIFLYLGTDGNNKLLTRHSFNYIYYVPCAK